MLMPRISVNEVDVPAEERTFQSSLEMVLGAEYEVLMVVQESEWVPRAVEYVRVFFHDHEVGLSAALGYVLKTICDTFKAWAVERLKRAPGNTERLVIYGPDNKALKTITVTSQGSKEE